MKRYDEALADFTRAIELDPANAEAVHSRALTYQAMERYDDALADHTRAIQHDPEKAWYVASRRPDLPGDGALRRRPGRLHPRHPA